MHQLVPYLNFSGECRQALAFYTIALGGAVQFIQTYGEVPAMEAPAGSENLVMHAEFATASYRLMAGDTMPGYPLTSGNQTTLTLVLSDVVEAEALFQRLSAGGTITMPLESTFWAARFGSVTDQFGISWMINCVLSEDLETAVPKAAVAG